MSRLPFRSLAVVAAAVVVCLAASPASAQRERDRDSWTSTSAVEISGQVRFADGGEPVVNATVRLERFGSGILEQMTTDRGGKFRFAGLPRGQYNIIAAAPCFVAAQQQTDVQLILRSYLVFELRRENSSPDCKRDDAASAGLINARVPVEARKEYERAGEAMREKKTEDAFQHLRKAISLYPEFFEAQLLLANAHMDERRWDKAETALRRALELDAESSVAHLWLGEVQRQQKHYDDAEKALLAGLKLDETSWLGHFTLARLYWDTNALPKAAPHVGRALQLKPDFAEAHLLAGNILLRVNEPQRAITEYEEYLRLVPTGEFAMQTRELVGKIKKALDDRKK